MQRLLLASAAFALSACAMTPSAPALTAPMALTNGGASVGRIDIRTETGGVALELRLHGLPPGAHGFHMHTAPSCAAATAADGTVTPAGGAGPHYDPDSTGHHLGPTGQGHLGDLPVIDVAANGEATQTLHVTRMQSADAFRGHALVIHAGGDNYSDQPALGGGGARLACGVVG